MISIERAMYIVENRVCGECDSSNSDWECWECDEALALAMQGLKLLKEQQPKTAHWKKRTGMMPPEYHGHYWCSNCEWHGRYNEREIDYKFCPACGAKMMR